MIINTLTSLILDEIIVVYVDCIADPKHISSFYTLIDTAILNIWGNSVNGVKNNT